MDKLNLLPDETLVDLNINNFKILQNKKLFCFGIDAVLLSDFAKIGKNDSVIDICSGNGIVAFLLLAKKKASKVCAFEYLIKSCELIKKSAVINDCEDNISVTCGDIKEISKYYPPNSFDVVTVNPPYKKVGTGGQNPVFEKAVARHEIKCDLNDVINCAKYLLKPNGRLYMVHKPYRLCDIICTMRNNKIEPKTLRSVVNNPNDDCDLILIEGVLGGKPDINFLKQLSIRDESGNYTKEINDIYERKD